MPTFKVRGADGILREVELELAACDICLKAVLQEARDLIPRGGFTEREWPAVREQLDRLGLLPENVNGPHLEDVWDR